MLQLLCHLWGDFILQNHWQANTKTKNTIDGWLACLLHCLLYTLCFMIVIHPSVRSCLFIFGTHFIIDKFRLAKYVQMFRNGYYKGNGTPAPDWLGTWLMFITDNILHVTINFIVLSYFN